MQSAGTYRTATFFLPAGIYIFMTDNKLENFNILLNKYQDKKMGTFTSILLESIVEARDHLF